MENREKFDHFLRKSLTNLSVDAEGIDWQTFSRKKERRDRRITFWFGSAMVAVFAVLWLLQYSRPQVDTSDLDVQMQALALGNDNTGEVAGNGATYTAQPEETDSKVIQLTKAWESQASVFGGENGKYAAGKTELFQDVDWKEVLEEVKPAEEQIKSEQVVVDEVKVAASIAPEMEVKEPANTVLVSIPNQNIQKEQFKKTGLYWQLQAGVAWNMPEFAVTGYGQRFVHKNYEGIRKSSERGLWGYGIVGQIGKRIKRLNVGVGLGISVLNVGAAYDFNYFEKPVRDADGSIIGYDQTSSSHVSYKNSHKYIFAEIPVTVQYRFRSRENSSVALHAGIINSYLNKIQGTLPNPVLLDQKENLRTENFKPYAPSVELGFEFEQKLGNSSSLVITPKYRKNLGLSQVQSLYKTNFNHIGVGVSFRRNL